MALLERAVIQVRGAGLSPSNLRNHAKFRENLNLYMYTLCSEKNAHSLFHSYLHELFVDLNNNCSEYTQGLVDSNNVKIRYSLRSMT